MKLNSLEIGDKEISKYFEAKMIVYETQIQALKDKVQSQSQ